MRRSSKGVDSDQEGGKALISLEENITKLEQSILANNHSPHVTFAGTKNGSSSNNGGGNGNIRRNSNASVTSDATFFQKKKRSFIPSINVKKRYLPIYLYLSSFLTSIMLALPRTAVPVGRWTCPHQVLAATLTLFQPGGADYAHHIHQARLLKVKENK